MTTAPTPISLEAAAKYYNEMQHQKEAFKYLQDNISPEVLTKFALLFRANPHVAHTPAATVFAPTPIGKISQRLSSLNIPWIKPDSSAANSDICINIVGISGVNANFTLNANTPNSFNDIFCIVAVDRNNKPTILQTYTGTTSPGDHYVYNPMNPGGAANVLEDTLHKNIWQLGVHGNSKPHEALVQTGNRICVARDGNKDRSSKNDKIDCGYFGINFHNGYDGQVTNVGNISAGCQVIRSVKEHKAAMGLIKSDYYFKKDKTFRFSYILLNGAKVFK